jgi:hypothetical protein
MDNRRACRRCERDKPKGVERVDHRVIKCIVVVLQSGGRRIDMPAEYGSRMRLGLWTT